MSYYIPTYWNTKLRSIVQNFWFHRVFPGVLFLLVSMAVFRYFGVSSTRQSNTGRKLKQYWNWSWADLLNITHRRRQKVYFSLLRLKRITKMHKKIIFPGNVLQNWRENFVILQYFLNIMGFHWYAFSLSIPFQDINFQNVSSDAFWIQI